MVKKTGTERTLAWRASLIAKGYRQKAFLLSPSARRALARVMKARDMDATAVVEALLIEAGKRR